MQLEQLKQQTYEAWYGLHEVNEAVCSRTAPDADEAFLNEAASYGDLAAITTWQAAFSAITAKFLVDAVSDDPKFLVEFHLCQSPIRSGWVDLLPSVISQVGAIPAGHDALIEGLRQLGVYGAEYASQAELDQVRSILDVGLQAKQTEPRINGKSIAIAG